MSASALGHGVTAWLSGAHRMTLSTVALQSNRATRWISANGTVVNLVFAGRGATDRLPATSWRIISLPVPATFSFPAFSTSASGAAVIRGLEPHWMWQLGLVVLGVASYCASMLVVAGTLKPFQCKGENSRSLRVLCWTPYFTDGILAGLAGLLNPLGWFFVIASALPSTLGANAGLLSLPGMMRRWRRDEEEKVVPNSAQRGVDHCGRHRQPAVYLRAWPRDHMVAMNGVLVGCNTRP